MSAKCKPYRNFLKDFKKLYDKQYRVYGPYRRKQDKRKIVIVYAGVTRIGKQYAKVKLEIKLGRILSKAEEVDHIDGNFRNDKFSNLQLLDKITNAKKDVLRRKDIKVKCAWCDSKFVIRRSQRNQNKNIAGPFCGKSCSGKYGAYIQNGGNKKKRNKVKKTTYYKLCDS